MGFGCWAFGGLQGALLGGGRFGEEPFGDRATALGDAGPVTCLEAPFGEDFGMVALQAETASSLLFDSPRPLKRPYCGARATRVSAAESPRFLGDGNAETESAKAAAIIVERIGVTRLSC